jgi:hypothetical protein
MYTPPRTGIAMATAEVQGEQVSGTACFLKSPSRPEAAVTYEMEKFMLIVLLNELQKIYSMVSLRGKNQRWSPYGLSPQGDGFVRKAGIPKTQSMDPPYN